MVTDLNDFLFFRLAAVPQLKFTFFLVCPRSSALDLVLYRMNTEL